MNTLVYVCLLTMIFFKRFFTVLFQKDDWGGEGGWHVEGEKGGGEGGGDVEGGDVEGETGGGVWGS